MAKYKQFRFPIDAYGKWIEKKQKIEARIKSRTNKNVKVPLTDVLRFYGKQQRFEWDDNILPFFLNKKKKRIESKGEIL